jgi:hypothetical protein
MSRLSTHEPHGRVATPKAAPGKNQFVSASKLRRHPKQRADSGARRVPAPPRSLCHPGSAWVHRISPRSLCSSPCRPRFSSARTTSSRPDGKGISPNRPGGTIAVAEGPRPGGAITVVGSPVCSMTALSTGAAASDRRPSRSRAEAHA